MTAAAPPNPPTDPDRQPWRDIGRAHLMLGTVYYALSIVAFVLQLH